MGYSSILSGANFYLPIELDPRSSAASGLHSFYTQIRLSIFMRDSIINFNIGEPVVIGIPPCACEIDEINKVIQKNITSKLISMKNMYLNYFLNKRITRH